MEAFKDYEAVLFDLDGTLLDTYALILESMRHTITTLTGRDYTDEHYMHTSGQPLEDIFQEYASNLEERDLMIATYREYNEARHDNVTRPFPGVCDMVDALVDAGVRIGVVTSKKGALARHGLDLFGLAEKMEVFVSSADTVEHKPDPAPVKLGCQRLELASERCVYVGDSPYDMHAGNGAGCTTVGVLWGMFTQQQLEAENPDYLVSSARELLEVLGI